MDNNMNRTLFVYPELIIFFNAIAFSGPPQIFCLATPMTCKMYSPMAIS